MQSQRKNSGSYFTRQQSTLLPIPSSKNTSINKKKFSIASQTENLPNFGKGIALCNLTLMTMEEIKENYKNTLHFLNNCHDFINGIFGESGITVDNSKLERMFNFRVPEVPNYFSILEMFLENNKKQIADLSSKKFENLRKTKRNKADNYLPDKEMGEEQIIFDLQQFLPKKIGDGPGTPKNSQGVMQDYAFEKVPVESTFKKNNDGERIDNRGLVVGLKNVGVKKRPSTSPSRLVKSEKDITINSTRHELKALSTTFEEILKTCNDFERKSKENLWKNDVPLNEPLVLCQNSREKDVNLNLDKFEQGDQKIGLKIKHPCRASALQAFKDENNIDESAGENFNLFDYALKNLRDSEYDSDTPPLTPRYRSREKIRMIPSQGLLTENLPNVLFNFEDSPLIKKSFTVLNAVNQTQSPKRVNEMFKKISKENLGNPEKAESCSDFNDSETFVKFIDNDNFSDEYEKEYPSQVFIGNCRKYDGLSDVKMSSSSDSVILTDEEFERKNRNICLGRSREKVSVGKEQRCRKGKNTIDNSLEKKIPEKPVKSHPLKLTDKDRSAADQNVLKTIGLFTEQGEIRPGVISILEEKQRMRFTQNPAKNVQFRTERKFDVKLRYNKDIVKQIEKQASKESLSGRGIENQPSDISIHSSAVTLSSSSISESDILSMEPVSDQTVINKF